nr:non-ribosomal peptide synthetase/type I polyketide synthase [Melittangium boletus]
MRERKISPEVLRALLGGLRSGRERAQQLPIPHGIAVAGIGCRLPADIDTPARLWEALRTGHSGIRETPRTRWDVDAYYDPRPEMPAKTYTKHGGYLNSIDEFDPAFFSISAREAADMDPQHRLLLEVVWEAIEDAGLPIERLRQLKTGVFIGMSTDDYHQLTVDDRRLELLTAYTSLGTSRSVSAGRISYLLGFNGPALQVDTSCSSSLVALHLAAQSLRTGECDAAIVAGVNLILSPLNPILRSRISALSPTGVCRAFDDSADGFVQGEGVTAVVLRRLPDATAEHGRIRAVLRASASNHNGGGNGLTAPNGKAQRHLLSHTLKAALLGPDDIDYLEAHGTGTRLGDPIEVEAIAAAYAGRTTPLFVGSVKTNFGHLEAAAGLLAFIKAALAVEHGEIAPQLNFATPNREIDWDNIPVQVAARLASWPSTGRPRRAAVSSFGISGSNAHCILEEAPAPAGKNEAIAGDEMPAVCIPLSAKDETALRELARRYSTALATSPHPPRDWAFSAATGRSPFRERGAVVGRTHEELARGLEALAAGRVSATVVRGTAPQNGRVQLGFAFSGQGAQYAGMGASLYKRFSSFRSAFDEVAALHLDASGGQSLSSLVFSSSDAALSDTGLAQPALFAFEYALCSLWRSLGVTPSALIGHSIGEYVAAHFAGVLSLHDSYSLVLARSRAMAALPPGGSMLSVLSCASDLSPLLSSFPSLELAADNSSQSCVLSGPSSDIDRLSLSLESSGHNTRRLHVSHAFHSAAMQPAMAALSSAASLLPHLPPSLPLASNLTGSLASEGLLGPDYWAQHLRHTVRFREGVDALVSKKVTHFLEIGPRPVLSGLIRSSRSGVSALSSLDSSDPERAFSSAAASLHALGVELDWKGLFPGKTPSWVSLPTYPFRRTRFWASKTTVESKKEAMQVDAPTHQASPGGNTAVAATARAVRALFAEQLSTDADRLDQDTPLLELGADSFVMVSAIKKLAEIWQVRMSVRDLFEVYLTVNQIAAHLVEASPVASSVAAKHGDTASPAGNTARAPAPVAPVVAPPTPSAPRRAPVPETPRPTATFAPAPAPAPAPARVPAPAATTSYQPPRFGGTKPAASPAAAPRGPANRLTPQQEEYLARFTARYTQKTGRSKEMAAETRDKLVNTRRSSSGFRLQTKELTYPIVATASKGSRIWDLDGNEYVDIAMGFGATLFGHNPDFVREALAGQIDKGYQIGPASELAGECARLISTATGMDRVLFLNSGTEAVMTAMRIARAATGRSKVVLFQNSYHGHFDGTMVTPDVEGGGVTARPMAIGTPQRMIDDIIVLPYANMRSIDTIRAHGHELAAVIVEPVQNRRPDLHPTEFLQALREVTRETGSILVFDEILVGFRIALGGSQEWFGVQADMVTYGKIIGGGLPLGVIAGRRDIMDRVDGGMWNYGDDSTPNENTTYTAGTFSKHPLAMTACHATLTEMLNRGGELQRDLNQRADRLMEILNEVFTNNQVPLMAVNFGSFFRFAQSGNLSFVYQPIEIDLFFYHLIEKGVYVWEGRTCFISTAHDDTDMDVIIRAVHESVAEMKAGGFWPGREGPGGGASGGPGSGATGRPSPGAKPAAASPVTSAPRAVAESKASAPMTSGHRGVDAGRSSLLGRAMRQDADSPGARAPEPARSKPPTRAMPPPIVDDSFIARRSGESTIDFSLYYFGDLAEDAQADKYSLLLDGARFADENGFQAVWLPERHFHSFGGFSPNPSVVTAALAQETQRVDLRASVLIPLQHPIRVAEEWAVLDNLSHGRVGLALASGWHANDFVLDPESWERKREVMIERLGALQHLWRANTVPFSGPNGQDVDVRIFPRPTRASLPVWLTTLGNRETWALAGRLGLGVLTNLIGQKISDIADNIRVYRQARQEAGLDPDRGHVTVLLHTLVGTDLNEVREKARGPFGRYLASSLGLFQQMVRDQGLTADFDTLTPEDRAFLLNAAYNRYVGGSALIGTVESTAAVVDQLVAAGVDELACFIDFGVEHDYVRHHLRSLVELKERYRKSAKKTQGTALTYTSTAPIVMPSVGNSAARPRATSTKATPALASSADDDDSERVALRLPLTGDQRMLWFLARMGADGQMAYAQTIVLRLTGPFDIAAMQRAYTAVIARHEALRTVFAADGESQSVLVKGLSEVPVIDLSALDPEPRARQLEGLLADEAERPFELTEALVRLAVVKHTETEHVLILTSHHLICDGVSVGILLTELAALYADARKAAELPPAPSFPEHVRWRLAQHQEAEYAREEAYWLRVIGAGLPALELPTDRCRPPAKTYDGDRVTLTLDAAFFTRLKGFSQEIRSTYFMVVLGAFAALFHRVARQDQVVVGVPFGGRGREGSETMVGYLSNVYPIVSRLELGDSVATYLDRLRATLLDAYDHQSYPFSDLVVKAMSSADPSRAPFFSVAFNWDRVDLPRLNGLTVEQLEFRPRYVDYDLMPNIMEVNGEVVISWDYNSQLFDRNTIETLANQFVIMIRALVRDAKAKVYDLPLRDEAADAAFLEAHATPRLAPPGTGDTLSALLNNAAAAHGERIAAIAGDARLTYAELGRRAHAIARSLTRQGIQRGDRVALLLEPSLELLTAIHGVLAAGAAYVPLDTRSPAPRLRELIAEAGAVAVIRVAQNNEDVVASGSVRDLPLDSLTGDDNPDTALANLPAPDDIAYVMYGSDTTGKPQGVPVRHRNVTRFLAAASERLAMDGSETLLNVSPASVDTSVPDFLLPLLGGGKVLLASTEERLTPARLISLIERHPIDFMQATPSLWRTLVDAGWGGKPGMRLCASGEMFPSSLATELLERGHSVWSGYGSTETTVWSNLQRVDRTHLARLTVPVGPALSNAAVYVVDARGRLAPEGHVGEILVGGEGVAVGSRFQPNPFGPGVVYRTGALGRYRAGGALELVERTELQVGNHKTSGPAANAQEPGRTSAPTSGQTTAQGPTATLIDIWREFLGVPNIGLDQDFFSLGGHSLSAVRMVARIREHFGVELTLGVLFEAPTIRQLARVIADKQARSTSASAPSEAGAIIVKSEPTHRHEPFELTDLQQAYWLGQSDSLSGGGLPGVAYLEHEILDLDVERFERAFQKVIERHPMLRAVIRKDGLQQVLPQTPRFRVDLVDLSGLTEEERSATLLRTELEHASRGLSADTWPTLALRVHRLDARRYRIHLGFPLLLGDLQSGRIFIRDLDLLYRDANAELPAVTVDYRDYVNTLRAARVTPAFERAETYWRNRLATLPLAPNLPRASNAQGKGSSDGGSAFERHEGLLPRASWDALKRRARAAGLTPAALVAAVYAEAIAEFSESPHFTLNLLYQNRPSWHPQIQEVVGNFSTTILLEVDNREPIAFEKRVRALQTQLWNDMEHAQVSGIQVVRELARQRGSSVASSMPVVLASSLHMSAEEVESDALFFTVVSNRLQTPHVWIDHQVMESRAGLRFHWDVRKGIFPPGLTASMFAIFNDLLAKLAKGRGWDETRPVELRPAELGARAQANASDKPIPGEMLHELFAAQVAQRPEHPAIIAGDRVISYGELRDRANRLAHRIRALGIGPNQLVAISMEKGWEQLVAALGILNAGAAYLPIDPSLPRERLHALMHHGRAALVLTQQALDNTVDWPEALPRLVVGHESETGDATPLPFIQTATDLAYVIFTSGSTGLPKGVMIDHRGAVNTVLAINRRFAVGPEDRVLAVSSLSFDLSVYDVFGLLAAGGTVVIPDAEHARDPAHWAKLVREHRVTLWNSVPQLMQLLVDREEQDHAAPIESLRVAMLSGDWIPVALPERIQSRAVQCQVVSLGGATEASIWSIIHPIDRVDPTWQSIPYGRPLDNQRFHVLDESLRPRPTWVQGELYIAGIGLAKGYLSDPDKTRERFITHPVTGERLYRTGDLGRYLPDGNIEFLGRADHQVKIQGYRIELGEIEATLEKHPRVKACVVTAHGPSRGERRLVAYVVGQEPGPGDAPAPVDIEALRKHLSASLPAYMVPGQFVLLSELPLTSNGKVDRKSLPAPDAVLAGARRAKRVAPQTPLQNTLAEIWREVLALDEVGIHDDFFAELGGHSFAAVRLLARVHAQLGRELPLSSMLEGPTIAHQADRVEQAAQEATRATHASLDWSPVVPLRKSGSETPLFLVHPVGGNVFCYRALVASIAPERPVYGLQARGFVGDQKPLNTLQEMANIYVDAVREIQPQGPYLLGGWSMGGLVALEMARVLEARGDEVNLLALIDSAVPGRKSMLSDLALLAWFMRDLLATSGRPCNLDMSGLETLDDGARLAAVLAQAKAAGAIAQDVTTEQLERLYRVFLHHSAAMDGYAPTPVRAPVVLLDAAESDERERVAPWRRLASSIKHHHIAGDHYSMMTEPHVATLAERLGMALNDRAVPKNH